MRLVWKRLRARKAARNAASKADPDRCDAFGPWLRRYCQRLDEVTQAHPSKTGSAEQKGKA